VGAQADICKVFCIEPIIFAKHSILTNSRVFNPNSNRMEENKVFSYKIEEKFA
jgi:hypothetical protein